MLASINRAKNGGGTVDEISLADFSAADRERVMELLLSQERVINLLYEKTFPKKGVEAKPLEPLPPLEGNEEYDDEDDEDFDDLGIDAVSADGVSLGSALPAQSDEGGPAQP